MCLEKLIIFESGASLSFSWILSKQKCLVGPVFEGIVLGNLLCRFCVELFFFLLNGTEGLGCA